MKLGSPAVQSILIQRVRSDPLLLLPDCRGGNQSNT